MKKKFFKKSLPLLLTVSSVIIVPSVLTSCSSIDSTLIDQLVSKENGMNLATGVSLSDLTKYALTTSTGNKKWLSQLENQAIYNWYKKLASSESDSTDKQGYARILNEEQTSIDNDWTSLYDSSKKSDGSDFVLKFQQSQLDPNGGTEDSWKQQKWMDWANSTFSTDLFKNLYFSLVDKNGNYVTPDTEKLQTALTNADTTSQATSDYQFAFSANAIQNQPVDNYVATEYAKFQKFIFDQWVQSNNPFIINYVQWSYSAPADGLDTIYSKDALGMSATSTTASASYTFPYFNTTNANDSISDVEKFDDFINGATSGYTDSGSQAATLGLSNLNKNSVSADTSSSYKLVTNSSSYTDLKVPLALGSTYLFSTAFTPTTTGSTSTGVNYTERSKLTKTATTTSTGSLDPITSNFIVAQKSSLTNSTLSSSGATTATTSTSIPYTQIADGLVKQILSSSAYTTLTSQTTTSGTTTSNVYNTTDGLFAIDAFIPSNTGLNNVLFLRDADGVYGITLDGQAYISNATSLFDAKTRAGNVVLYRYLQNQINTSATDSLSIDLLSTLKTFFTDNSSWLIYKYATTTNDNTLFDFGFINGDLNAKAVLDDLSTYLYIVDRYQRVKSYQEAVYTDKNTYSANYGLKTYLNGFAAQYPYTFINASSTATATFGYYSQLSTLKLENPFGTGETNVTYYSVDPYDTTNGIYKKLNEDIAKYVSGLSLSPLSSTFEGFKYSQYIYTNDFFINQAITAVGADGNLLSDAVKKNILLNYFNDKHQNVLTDTDYMNSNSYIIKNYTSALSSVDGTTSSDVSQYLNSALSNYFFNSTFDSSTSKWVGLKKENYTDYSTSSSSTYPTISYDDLDTYRRDMWVNSNISYSSSGADNYINFLTVLVTIDYLLDNDGINFLNQLGAKLSNSDSKLSFLVWESSSDKTLETGKAIATNTASTSTTNYMSDATKLLYGDTTSNKFAITNINNSSQSAYYPSKSNTNSYVEKNNNNSAFVDSTTLTNYYKHVADLKGFQGIETNVSSSNISTLLSTALFTIPTTFNTNKTGLLFGYANSKADLVSQVASYSISQVNSLANTLNKLLGIDISSVTNVQTLQNLINTSSEITDECFSPRNGYVNSGDFYKDSNDSVNTIDYGSYVIQLSGAKLSSIKDFMTYLKSAFDSNDPKTKPTSGSSATTNTDSLAEAQSVFWNLVVQLATDTTIQNTAITNIASSNKVSVYDVRLNTQLGSRWVLNYKDQS